jgi:hypothetical protein
MTRPDYELEDLLRTHLSRQLDPQRGRARTAFERETNASPAGSRRGLRLFAASGLIAASVAILIGFVVLRDRIVRPAPDRPEKSSPLANAGADPVVERLVTWRAVDEGPRVVAPAVPVRKVRYEAVEEIEWAEPLENATIRLSIPQEQVVLVRQMAF